MKKTLWQKNNVEQGHHADIIEQFTVGHDTDFDILLAPFDVIGSLAHAEMLEHIGLLTTDEGQKIKKELNAILNDIQAGTFKIDEGVEDIHSQIELLLTERIGDAGKKIHTGRSRNDQVLLDIKLFIRHQIKDIAADVQALFNMLIALSEKHKNDLLPGYTHLQMAMPSSFGLWFGAYAESLADDIETLAAAYNVSNKNPLGSGAGYGSSFPLNRSLTTELLGFETMNYNVVYAQMTRGKTEKITAMAMACIAATLSKLSYDICLYMSQNFGFVSFPDALTTGSSIMPHKKNPDVFELIRARCNRLQALPNELTLLTNNLPSGYHRDMQLTKECLFPAITELKNCLSMAQYMLSYVQVTPHLLADTTYNPLYSVEEVNKEVMQGMPFREAYKKVAGDFQNNSFNPSKVLHHTHEGSIGNLCNDEIQEQFNKIISKILTQP